MQQTSTEHPDVTRYREAMDAFNEGDMQRFADMTADDVVWHQIGAPTLHGKQELASSMPGGDVDWQITGELHDAVASDEHLIALVEAHATRGDKTLDYRTAEIMHVRDGKITERWAFSDDTQRIIDFFA